MRKEYMNEKKLNDERTNRLNKDELATLIANSKSKNNDELTEHLEAPSPNVI